MDGTVLVADDDRTIRTVLTQALTRAGCKVHATSSLTTLMRWVAEGKGDVVISDVMMPDGNGLEMLPKIAEDRPGLPVIVISAQNTIMTAIKAAEADAYDYLPKPFDLPELMKRTAKALSEKRTTATAARSEEEGDRPEELPLVGRTEVMQGLYRLIARVMNTDMPLLVTGESGTGKSLIARAIHDFSDRRTLPYVTATAAELIELEGPARLLSQVKGGTLLIDELLDLPDEAQARLVRMMDATSDHSPRFMATSQKDLAPAMEAGELRADLYYRLCGTELHVPALRERVEDIALLAEHFLIRAENEGAPHRTLSEEGRELLRHFAWPGNVRQLENVVRRLALTARSEEIGKSDVAAALGPQTGAEPMVSGAVNEKLSESVARHLQRYFDLHGDMLPPPGLYGRLLREVETPLIEIALAATGGNQAKCAELLGINRNTLRKKITDLDIEVTRRRKLM
ncbi:response regulator [Phaeobacter gallaeciensis]|uniref:response regulator n=1 Tax=Phaeobacter gallaeciensis TaxID=60890 RepID=UPI00237FCBF1|nr:response regulator [Phaeobacter gallaeciensis]MDE4096411.1 response regulator [Phaeobacter gallaeciensis]MDE4105222.1 response regulator [Phaeobacter gallaeciensis]MDE4109678.1 response regulator [Phaeobacter gallaeciensis]MDE4114146.1 response regulator [Phaeobacter gallaeciensis]MDE4118613.1 response regulator [Phaeobacter gallaeciensis]